MSELKGKIDFTLFVSASNANPNGDPLNGTVRELIWMDLGKFQMSALNEKSESACRIWDRKFSCSQMTERTTHSRV